MGDEFQAGVCAENWWTMNLSQNGFGSSFCSPINMEIFSWPLDFDTKTRTRDESGSANSEGSIVFQDTQKPINQDSVGLSSSTTTDWYQTLLHDSKRNLSNCESLNLSSNYQQDASTVDYSQVKKDWSLENLYTLDEDSCVDKFKGPINVHGFPLSSSSYSYPSSLIQTLFDSDSDQETVFGNRSMDYPAISKICEEKLNEFSSSSFLKHNSVVLPKQQPLISHSPLPNNLAWNTCSDGFSTPVQSQFLSPRFENQLNCSNPNVKSNKERIQDMTTLMKSNNNTSEPEFKRTRIETPSPLPTFKVRKEKLGDRVTALQQLVSPFGKTDTASVLHEAIEYIKLLHDQVTVLIAPYMKGGSPILREQTRKGADEGVIISQELRGRGLCVVPISSIFPVAAETTADYWMPTFGGSFR